MPHTHTNRSGFALVIALGLMAFVLLLLLSITTLVQVETRSSQTQLHQMEAEQGALLGLQVALGELQKNAGPDQRVTATAGIVNGVAADGSTQHYTGVWSSEPNIPAANRFIQWLVSSNDNQPAQGVFTEVWSHTGQPVADNGSAYSVSAGSENDYVLLVGNGTVDSASSSSIQAVVAEKVAYSNSDAAQGKYAWWIGDEGVKARINLTDASQNTALGPNETKQAALQTLSSSARGNVATLTGLSAVDLQSSDLASKLLETSDLALDASAPSEDLIKAQFHDLTTYSSGVLADARNGGLKQDLSLAFELSDADFDRSVFGSNGPDTIDSPGFGEVQPIFRLPNTTGVDANGPAWHLLRDYYTIYQRMVTPMTNPTLNAQALLPNHKELNPGGLNHDWEKLPALRYIADNPAKMDPLRDGAQGDPLRSNGGYLPIPVKASYLPYVQRHIVSIGLDFEAVTEAEALATKEVTDPDTDTVKIVSKYPNVPMNYTNTNNYEFRKMRQVVSPSFVVHNPYNVSIRHYGIATAVDHVRFSIQVDKLLDRSFDYTGITVPNWHMLKVESGTIQPGAVQVYEGVPSNGHDSFSQPGPAKPFWETTGGSDVLIIPVDPAALNDPNVTVIYRPFGNVRWAYWMYHGVAVPGVDARISSNLSGVQVRSNKFVSNYGGQHADKIYLTYNNWYGGEDGGEDSGRTISTESYRSEILAPPFPFLYYDFFLKPAEADPVTNRFPYPGLTHTNPLAPIMQSRNLFPTSQSKPDYGWPMYAPNWQLKVYTTESNVPGMDALQTSGVNYEKAFWGASNEAGGSTHVAAIELPTSPPVSIGQLQNANVSLYAHMPALAIGNSFASPYIPSNATYNIFQNREGNDRIFYDLSYLCNEVLWDRYFFSSYSRAYDANADAYNGSLGDSFDSAFDSNNASGSLPNPRMELALENETIADARTKLFDSFGDPLSTAYERAAENLLVKGSFNLHSTSVNAWKTMLASSRDMAIYQSGESAATNYTNNRTPLTRIHQPIAGAFDSASFSYDNDEAWGGFATLSDNQLDNLANAIVAEIKLRVANQGTLFTSLSAFVNRSLSNDTFGLTGLLQAAIDKSGINSSFTQAIIEADSGDLQTPAGDFPFPFNIRDGDGQARSTATSATANLTQGDLLQVIGSFASVRSDTFRIRSYGEALDPVTGEPNGRAWCEAIVQRIPEPVNPGAANPSDSAYWEPQTGDSLGRQFKIIHFRWLSGDEV